MRESAVLDRDLQPARRERAGEHHLAGVLADVDEPARARELAAEPADVDVALRVHLRQAEAGEIEPAAVVEVELLVLVDHRPRIEGRAEVEPALRQPADDARLRREGQVLEHLLLGGHGRDALRHADAEIDHAARRQLESAPARDDLSLVRAASARPGPAAPAAGPRRRGCRPSRRSAGGSRAPPRRRSPPARRGSAPRAGSGTQPPRYARPGRSRNPASSWPPWRWRGCRG